MSKWVKVPYEQLALEHSAPLGASPGDKCLYNESTWMYCYADAAFVEGNILTPKAAVAYDTVCSGAAAESYEGDYYPANAIIYDSGSAFSLTVNQYAGCYLVVDSGTGVGQCAKILKNSATKLYLDHAFDTTLLIANSDITIMYPTWWNRKSVASETAHPIVAIAQQAVTQYYYFWAVVKGWAKVLVGASAAAGGLLIAGDDTAGTAAIAGAGAEATIELYAPGLGFGHCKLGTDTADTTTWAIVNCMD